MKKKDLFIKYLDILNVEKKPASLEYLKEIVKAQLTHIPFEDVSKTYYRKLKNIKGIPDFDTYINGIEKYHFGGTCYPINYYFNELLKYLGFNVKLCGADMKKPDVHMFNIVTIANTEYIVDTGFAAPFFTPIPRGLKEDFIISRGGLKYVFKPAYGNDYSVIEQYDDSKLSITLNAKTQPREIHEFENVIEESFSEKSTFVNSLFLTRHYEERTIIIYNLKLTEHSDSGIKSYEIKSRNELIETVHREFNIPINIIVPVLKEMSKLEEGLSKGK